MVYLKLGSSNLRASAAAVRDFSTEVGSLDENQVWKRKKRGGGWLALGYLLAVLLVFAAPVVVMAELMSLLPVILAPSVGIALLYRWFGRGPALCAALLQILADAVLLGTMGMWIAVCASILPLIALYAASARPFFEQLCIAIGAFMLGILLSVGLLYLSFGGNAIARALELLPQMMQESLRTLPAESLNRLLASLPAEFASGMTVEGFIENLERAVEQLVPLYQHNLPGLLFGGAMITALLCAPLLAVGRGADYRPFREWALPASATGGLLLILLVSFALNEVGVQGAEVAFQAVFDIVIVAFCVQGLASFARRLHQGGKSTGMQHGVVALLAVLAWFGASLYLALYGCASALFGSRGALKLLSQRNQNK